MLPVAKHELFSDTDESVPATPENKRQSTVRVHQFTSEEKEHDDDSETDAE